MIQDIELIGSEKQIAWAKNILIEMDERLWKHVKDAMDRVERGTMPQEWAEDFYNSYVEVQEKFLSVIKDKLENHAGNIIDRKHDLINYCEQVAKLAKEKFQKRNITYCETTKTFIK